MNSSLVVTTTYENPDLDGYGCIVAYAELLRAQGKNAQPYFLGRPLAEVAWMVEAHNLKLIPNPSVDEDTQVAFLDASSPELLPKTFKPAQVVEVIDHREVYNIQEFSNATAQIELVGAAATLVAERFKKEGLEPSRESALLLYGGILANTLNFTTGVTDRDTAMAAWVKQISGAGDDIAEGLYRAKSDLTGYRLEIALIDDLKVSDLRGKRFAIGQLEVLDSRDVVADRAEEMLVILHKIKEAEKSLYTFVHVKDLGDKSSHLLCLDQETQTFLADMPNATWKENMAFSKQGYRRKGIIAWLDKKLS